MVKSLNFVGLFSDLPKIRGSHDWETTKLQENMVSCHVNRIILGKICTLDVWYSSVNLLIVFRNHE